VLQRHDTVGDRYYRDARWNLYDRISVSLPIADTKEDEKNLIYQHLRSRTVHSSTNRQLIQ